TITFRCWVTTGVCERQLEGSSRSFEEPIPQNPVFDQESPARPSCPRMKNPPQNSDSSKTEHLALQRWGLISQVQDLLRQHWPLSAALEHVAASCPLQPQNSHPVSVAKRTLEDWYYAFQKGGFDALRPKARSDRGLPRRLSPA